MGRRRKGEGTIRQRKDGRFEARVTVGSKSDGSPEQCSVYGTTEEVIIKRAELITKLHQGLIAEPNKMTVRLCLERSLRNRVNVTEGSRYKLECEVKALVEIIGSKRLKDLRASHVRDAYTHLAERGESLRSQRRAAMHLRTALREAVQEDLIVRSVADGIKISAPRVEDDDRNAQAWTPDEVDLFLEAARGELIKKPTGGKRAKERKAKGEAPELISVPLDQAKEVPLYPLFYLMLGLGLRRGEALGLPWTAINFKDATVRIHQALSMTGKGSKATIKVVKTPSSRRTLYLNQDVLELLKAHRARQKEQRAFLGADWRETGLVFTTSLGTQLSPRNALRSFKSLIKHLPVKQIRLHDLRHTYASLALQRNVPIEVVSERLGHARVDITLNVVYRHLYDVERRAAALSLSDLLGHSGQTRALN